MGQSATRERILEAGKRVIFRKGFHRSRVSDITSEAGVAHGTFYLYFKTKEDFLLDLLRSVREEMISLMDQGMELLSEGRTEEAKDLLFLRTFDLMVREKELAKIFFFEAICTSRRFQEFYRESKDIFFDKIKRSLQEIGVPNPEVKTHILLGSARHLIENLILRGQGVREIWLDILRDLGVYS